ncbi:MAG: aldehyde ferredoxin oxidoreductase C-terminal domain-containing protein [Syntrophorhabdales bacterium]
MEKILRLDMARERASVEETPAAYRSLGGRGLTSRVVSNEVPATTDPLGPLNKLVFAPGILGGTSVPNSGRLSVGAKSPLTGGIKEANAGGAAAQKIARLGFRAIVIEGAAKGLTIVKIDRNGVHFVPASAESGAGNYEMAENMRRRHGDKISVISIGPAGERKLKAASVMVTSPDFHLRAAARGGLGAVMGSKNLKAVLIDDTGSGGVEVADEAGLKETVGHLSKAILSNPVVGLFRELGTPGLVMMVNSLCSLPTRNYSTGQFQGAEKICGEYMAEIIKKRPNGRSAHRCMDGCIISCSNVYTDEKGETIVSGLEYETIGLTGSNCMIEDLDAIARINRICNDFGLDTMDVGGAIGLAMEAGMLAWGDGAGAASLLMEIKEGTDLSTLIGNGCRATGERLGARRVPHVKGQCLSAYDPRGLKGLGVTFATSPMGADHTAGIVLPNPGQPDYSPVAPTGQADVSRFMQTYMAAVDTLGLCMMAGLATLETGSLPLLVDAVRAVTGKPVGENYLNDMGSAVLKTETEFNRAAGFTEKDDRLPAFFSEEPLLPGGHTFDVPEAEIDSVNRF